MRNVDELFRALSRSRFRASFRLGPRELAYCSTAGQQALVDHARTFVAERLAPAAPRNDGKQTPLRGHPAFVAQHATATCCRGCLAKWHSIEPGRELSSSEQEYVVGVISRWIVAQSEVSARGERPTPSPGEPFREKQLDLFQP